MADRVQLNQQNESYDGPFQRNVPFFKWAGYLRKLAAGIV